ncbi:MAG: DUF72 domain-containing protein, partial [Chitinophagaceae bacterium]
ELHFKVEDIQQFLQAASGIGSMKGCILLQFPGKINLEHYSQLEKILEALHPSDTSQQWPVAVEFRNPAWYERETTDLLREFNASMVLHDHAKANNLEGTPINEVVYLRLHGPDGNYRNAYSTEFLENLAARIGAWLKERKSVYCYFNNSLGDAFKNARELQALTNTTPGAVAL